MKIFENYLTRMKNFDYTKTTAHSNPQGEENYQKLRDELAWANAAPVFAVSREIQEKHLLIFRRIRGRFRRLLARCGLALSADRQC
jgi:hypothetical protein